LAADHSDGLASDSTQRRPIVVVLVLALASAMANAGSSLLSACLPLIKAEFGFSDTQLGLLTGYASAVTIAALAFPITAWAARWGNARVFGACMSIYGAALAVFAACGAFWQFVAAQLASGFGPAAEMPLGQAIVSDHYPPERRSGALALYSAGYFVGITGGLTAGGYLAAQWGWRQAFVVFGLAAVAIAVLQVRVAPDRATSHSGAVPSPAGPGQREAFLDLVRNPTYLHITLGYAWASFATFGLTQWMPSFYNRQFGLAPEHAAAFFGGAYLAGSLLGLLAGGVIGNRLGSARPEKLLAFCMVSYALTFPLIAAVLFAPNLQVAFAAHVAATFVGAMPNGPVFAMISNTLPRERRVLGVSVLLLALTLFGAGGGPLLVGMFSDALAAEFGQASLRWAMLGVKLLAVVFFLHLGYAWIRARQAPQASAA
jgi:MFS transporter, Spinster family, sphingosine-1-phosphate transporter